MKFTYVNIIGREWEGWLNLFFGEYCVAMVKDIELANMIRQEIPEKGDASQPSNSADGECSCEFKEGGSYDPFCPLHGDHTRR